MRVPNQQILAAAVLAAVILLPTAAWAERYVHIAPDNYKLTPMSENDTTLKLGMMATSSNGAQQCWADGGNVVLGLGGNMGCWAEILPAVHNRLPRTMLAFSRGVAGRRAMAMCANRDVISIGVANGRLVCIDTPTDVMNIAISRHSDRPGVPIPPRN